MNVLAICAGVGGIELGLRIAAPGTRTVAHVEREIGAAAILAARMEDGAIHPAPIWSDVATFDGTAWRGLVDGVTAGIPCQPWSVAGKRGGIEDERWIWDHIRDVVRDVQPGWCFFECTPGLVRGGLGPILRDLSALGFDAQWACLRADDVGDSQKRDRIFVLAYACSRIAQRWREPGELRGTAGEPEGQGNQRQRGGDAADDGGEDVAGAECARWSQAGRRLEKHARPESEPGSGEVASTTRQRRHEGRAEPTGQQRGSDATERGGAMDSFPPGPDDDWTGIPEYLWPAIKPGVRLLVDGVPMVVDAARTHQLRAAGNGVVALCATTAFVGLARRAGLMGEQRTTEAA